MTVRRLRPWAVLGLLLASIPAMGDEIRLVPMIEVKEEYNDNYFLDPNNKTSDFITTLSPGLKFEKNTERLKAMLSGRLAQRFLADNSYLNDLDQFYAGNVSYAFTPRLRLGALAGYSQDSSPNRDLQTTGMVLNTSRRDSQNYGVSGDYSFTETTSATLSGGYNQDRYAEPQNSFNNDLDAYNGSLMVIHDISALLPETKARFGLNYSNYQFTTSTVENYSATVGLSRKFSEVWSVSADVGPRYTPSQLDVTELQFVPPASYSLVTRSEDSSGWGVAGNAVVSYQGEKTSLDFSLSQNILPASNGGGASNRTGVGLSMRRRFTEEFSGMFSSGYFLNKSDQGQYSNQPIDEKTLYVTPGIRYEITRDMSVDATYTYYRIDYQNTDSSADQSLAMVRFSLQYPLFE